MLLVISITLFLDYLQDPNYEGRCENNGYVDTGVVCLNGGSCWNPPLGRRAVSACLCCYGYSGKTCEIPPRGENGANSEPSPSNDVPGINMVNLVSSARKWGISVCV